MQKILSLNIGSSSFKAKLFEAKSLREINSWKIDSVSEGGLNLILQDLGDLEEISLITHRVVHGGDKYQKAVLIDKAVKANIKKLFSIAPIHNPINFQGIVLAEKLFKNAKNIAVFDTAFHQTLDEKAYIYGLPYSWYQKYKIRRYGFHGISHKYISSEAINYLRKQKAQFAKIITCHLGNGSSITAIKDSKSIDTSMGFTPLEGVMMGTRCGDIDPAIVFWIAKKEKLSLEEVEDILQKKSGLLGISGLSHDIRILLDSYHANPLVKLAFDIYTYKISKYIASYIGVLGGLDALVFSGGIGENAVSIRNLIINQLSYFGLFLDSKANQKNSLEIQSKDSKAKILLINTNEELQMAKEAKNFSN